MINEEYTIADTEIFPWINAKQRPLIDEYIQLRDSNAERAKLMLTLGKFMDALSPEQKAIIQFWQKQQLCKINPMLICSLEMSKFAVQNNIQGRLAMSQDGQNFLILMNDSNREHILKQLNNTYPGLDFEVKSLEEYNE
jgi:hypothetical protein